MVLGGLTTPKHKPPTVVASADSSLTVGPLDNSRNKTQSELARFDWIVGDYARATPVLVVGDVGPSGAIDTADDGDIEAELQALHQARGTLAIVARRARERLTAPGFAPDRSLQRRTLDQLDRWAIALQRREAWLAKEWRRRHPLPHRVGVWRRLCTCLSSIRRRRPAPSADALA
jgi:hypothetical protein